MRWLWILLLVFSGSAAAADAALGRLFYSPEQRAALDEARRRNIRAEEQAAEASKRPKAPAPRSVEINGLMRRSDGESTVWVNGKPVDGETDDGMRVRLIPDQAGVTVRDPEKGRTVRLKVGQRADLLTGRVEENYERRRATAPEATGETAPENTTASRNASGARRADASARKRPDRASEKDTQERDPPDAKDEGRSEQ